MNFKNKPELRWEYGLNISTARRENRQCQPAGVVCRRLCLDGSSLVGLPLHQHHVDAPAVHIDHLEAPAAPHKMVSRLRQFMQLREDETGQGHVVASRRLAYPD